MHVTFDYVVAIVTCDLQWDETISNYVNYTRMIMANYVNYIRMIMAKHVCRLKCIDLICGITILFISIHA